MKHRWHVRCVSLDGTVRYEAGYLFKRNALEDAHRLASPLYDVIVERADGSVLLVWPHSPPPAVFRRLEHGT